MNQSSGSIAEQKVADYLVNSGYKIIDRNWKTKYCEIDIIAQNQKTIYFVEVKYRKNDNFGSGLEYITPKKLKQIEFAAKMWVSNNNWKGDFQLSAIELSGDEYLIKEFIEDLL